MDKNAPITVGVVHEHHLVRAGVRDLLHAEDSARLVVDVANVSELEAALPGKAPVQVLVVQLMLPLRRTLDAIAQLRRLHSGWAIVVLGELTDAIVHHIICAQVRAVLPTCVEPGELRQAVRAVAAGGMHTNAWVHNQFNPKRGSAAAQAREGMKLTDREYDVLRLIAHKAGYTYEMIGEKLGITKRTVETHRDALYAKFGVNSKVALLHEARERRYLE
ncbi:MAG: response regulator transcription factor [Flavobacteriales bacterium]|nr:response regulator transcription factor [Flavobacteriales bacterium]